MSNEYIEYYKKVYPKNEELRKYVLQAIKENNERQDSRKG